MIPNSFPIKAELAGPGAQRRSTHGVERDRQDHDRWGGVQLQLTHGLGCCKFHPRATGSGRDPLH